ncbi:two-component system, sensor histidine kinase and response regulator [Gammaproteobacteria bacterium]
MWQSGLISGFLGWSRKWKLSHQLLFSSLLVTLILTVTAGTFIINIEEKQHYRIYETNLKEKLSLLMSTIMDDLNERDVPGLKDLLIGAMKKNSDILSLEVFDHNEHLVAEWKDTAHPSSAISKAMKTELLASGRLRMTWDMTPYLTNVQQHVYWLLYILMLALLILATSLILLTRLIVLRPIRVIHESLQAEIVSKTTIPYAARELQELGDAISILLNLKRENNRSELRYRRLFDNMISGCMVLSGAENSFQILNLNEHCRLLPALAIGERQITNLNEIIKKDDAPVLYEALRNTAENQVPCHIEELSLIESGNDYLLDCHIFALDADEIVLSIRDVTERKIAHDMYRAKEAAEQANKLKSAFLASMSHEIRTPLNGVLSMVELLRGTYLSNKQQHWVEAIRGSGQILLSTINDILDFSKIEAGRLRLENIRFSLSEIIGNLFNATSQRAFEKDLELVLQQDSDVPDQLTGDPFHIQQILINLVGNAIKFTECGEVKITIKKRNLSGNRFMLCVSVRDTGIGIAPNQMQRVFLPFEQGVGNRSLPCEGTGLGLPISKRLVDAMGGTIGVASHLGEGSVFSFEVPVGVVDVSRTIPQLFSNLWYECQVLVWIRHEAVRESIIHTLSSFGFRTPRSISSVSEVVDQVCTLGKEDCFYLVVLDDNLIGHEGSNLLTELEARGRGTKLLVLYVVNMFNRDRSELDRLDQLPNTTYVMKPIHASSLLNALQALFGISNKSRATTLKQEDSSWRELIERLGVRERLSGARILLVEDNLINQEVAVEALSMAGIEVQVAVNGKEAVDMLGTQNVFDGVLMDLQMPVMGGFEATQIIRQRYTMEVLPIIAMTAGVFFKDRQRSLEVGMNDHVSKPVNLQNLMETLMKWVKPAHSRSMNIDQERNVELLPPEEPLFVDGNVNWEKIDLPGIQIHNGLSRIGGNQKLYFKLLKSFVKTHDNTEVEILAALANRDVKTLRRLAHTIKGVALTLGAESLHNSADLAEKETFTNQLGRIREVVNPLIVQLNKVLNSIQTMLKLIYVADGDSPENAVEPGSSNTTKIYSEIINLLEHGDIRLQEVCVAHQAMIRTWFGDVDFYETFMQSIEFYHFEEAREVFLRCAVVGTSSQLN